MRGKFWKGVQCQWSASVVLLLESLKKKGRVTNNAWNSRWKATNMRTKPTNQRISVNSKHKKQEILPTHAWNQWYKHFYENSSLLRNLNQKTLKQHLYWKKTRPRILYTAKMYFRNRIPSSWCKEVEDPTF